MTIDEQIELASTISAGIHTAHITTIVYIAKVALIWLIVYVIIQAIYNYSDIGKDDSDHTTTKDRSGLNVHTDYKTGLQYFSTIGGGLTPRLNTDGTHMQALPK